ncbi:ABC transporter permease subunit [Kosmotoga olearia]|uniref:ABC-2 type transport system permease protein n=1 Tax=Kosmotoga olearia (strain ATCC BAA-1733 / DSM 21960 / TBF 19.5.1) TaxID=521045 RepID=C5CE82_KOSOT|nr:ABC transporter permease subunit [Kosmotoga olearia]ACR79190.1 hypothetical protein Kole_0467 [Kosmotoga olearia TBF 19.5.1]
MNVFKKDFRGRFRSFFIWTIIISLFGFLYIPFTDKLLEESEPMLKMLENIPKVLLNMFNMDVAMFSKPEGIFGSEGMSFVYILTGVFAAMMAGALFSREFEEKTIEYLLVKPISRRRIFLEKSFTLITFVILLSGLFTITTVLLFRTLVHTAPYNEHILFGFGLYVLSIQLFFAAVSTLVSLATQKSSLTTSLTLGILIFMYFGNSLSSVNKNLAWMGKISVFHYLPLIDTVVKEKIFVSNALVIILVALLIFYGALEFFKRKDVLI